MGEKGRENRGSLNGLGGFGGLVDGQMPILFVPDHYFPAIDLLTIEHLQNINAGSQIMQVNGFIR